VTCGQGTSQRSRKCDSPAPANGGLYCEGVSLETVVCGASHNCPGKNFFLNTIEHTSNYVINLRIGTLLRKHSVHVKKAALVLLNLCITENQKYHTVDAPWRMSGTLFLNVNNIQSVNVKNQKNEFISYIILITLS